MLGGCSANHPQLANSSPTTAPSLLEPCHPLPDGSVPGVNNFAIISADVWRGAQPSREGFRLLADMGVKTIIDLQEIDESKLIPDGVRYVPVRTSAFSADRLDTTAVLAAIRASPKPVFIHCHEGRDRTGLAVAAYRLRQGMTCERALSELDNFHVNFWWRSPIKSRVQQLASARVDERRCEIA